MVSNVHIFQISCLILFTVVKCEVFSAITDVEKLLHTHECVLNNLKHYVQVEENRLAVIKSYLEEFRDEHEKASKDIQKYVRNPINAVTVIKRLSIDFERLKTVASDTTEFVWDRELLYTTENDLMGAAVAIARLQFFYKLNTTHLADGNLKGVFGSPMTASDCYTLAVMLNKKKGWCYNSYASEWFDAALEKLGNKHDAWAEKLHALKSGEITTDSVLELSKKSVEGKKNENSNYLDDGAHQWNYFTALCRSEVEVPAANASKLHCSYLRSNPFLKLAPVKMEEIHKDPNVFLFYDVLSDNEMEILKQNADPKLKRTMSVIGKNFYEHRIGKNAWLDVDIDAVVKVRQRAADFTGFSMLHAEPLQVLNYGIGGHYNLHYDAYGEPEHFKDRGNRIATVLFYMSDVMQGGATVFTVLNLTVTPKKGTALFWENLHPSGEMDQRTRHAACPVLYGNKWVSNIWIHEAGQELLRPCPVVNELKVSNRHVLVVVAHYLSLLSLLLIAFIIIVKLYTYFVGIKYDI